MTNHPQPGAATPAPREFIDFVVRGYALLQQRDKDAWTLGDLAADFVIKLGRPKDSDAPTLSDLAREWDVDKSRVSRWRNTAAFYPVSLRRSKLSFTHHDIARVKCGDLEDAMEHLMIAEAEKLGIRAFRRRLAGIYSEGPLAAIEVPAMQRRLIPDGEHIVWATFAQYQEDDNDR